MNIYSKISIELLDWLVDEIEQKKYNRKQARIILKTAIKYNKPILKSIYEIRYYSYDREKNTLSLIEEIKYYNMYQKNVIKEIVLK